MQCSQSLVIMRSIINCYRIIRYSSWFCNKQRWSRGHKARGQRHKKNPRPRTAFPRTDTLEAKDRNARGLGQGPRTQAQVLSKKKRKKKGLHKNFSGYLHKKRFPKNFSSAPQDFNNSKNSAVLGPRTGQGQGLDLRGQGLQNVSSRTPPLVIRGKASQESNIFRNLLADGDRLIEEELMFKSPRI